MSDNQPSNCEITAGANAQEDQSNLVKNEQNELENRNENNVEIKMETDSPEKRPSATENNQEDDDLEEGELKDDEDDDDDDEEIRNEDGNISDTCLTKTKSSDDESNAKSSSSSSSSSSHCSDEESKEHNSSRSSSKLGSNKSYTNKRSDLSSSMDYRNNRLSSSTSHREERFRSNWERDREDPSEKAAKLISMRTKLLEARAREIEMKFQKHRGVIAKTTTTVAPTNTLNTPLTGTLSLGTPSAGSTQTTSQDKVKMTITKPSISYSENPHPPSATSAAIEAYTSAKRKLQSKMSSKSVEEKVRKSKKKSSSKKKKKTSKTSKKHKKHRSESVSTKKLSTSSHKLDSNSQDLDVPFDTSITNDHQGPRTPPDNHVLTLDDEQIEWPSHLIKMTLTQPSISYSVNPKSVLDYQKYPMSSTSVKVSSKPDLNVDYDWYYNYFVKTVEMNHNQAQHQAHLAILSSGSYERETLVRWFLSRGLEILPEEVEVGTDANEPPRPQTPKEPKETTIPIAKIEFDENKQKEAKEKDKLDGETPASEVKIEPTGDVAMESSTMEEPDSELKVSEDKKAMPEDHDNVKNEEVKENNKDEVRENDIQEVKEKDIQEVEEKDKQEAKEDENKEVKDEILCQTGAAMITKRPIKPIITIIKSQKEIVLPNGQTLPAGTIQKIVHPYPKLKSELLGPFFDMY